MSNLVYKNQTTLKRGYTTGSCAAAAAQAATLLLLTGQLPEVIELHTPKGIDLSFIPSKPASTVRSHAAVFAKTAAMIPM